MPKHVFWPIIDCSSLYATRVTRDQNVLRRLGGRRNFRSRNKDGCHTVRPAISEDHLPHANFAAISSIEPELLPIFFCIAGIREFHVFCEKYWKIFFRSHPEKDVNDAESRKSVKRCDPCRCTRKYKQRVCAKIDTGDDNSTHMHPCPP